MQSPPYPYGMPGDGYHSVSLDTNTYMTLTGMGVEQESVPAVIRRLISLHGDELDTTTNAITSVDVSLTDQEAFIDTIVKRLGAERDDFNPDAVREVVRSETRRVLREELRGFRP